jgi:hypothetical protein
MIIRYEEYGMPCILNISLKVGVWKIVSDFEEGLVFMCGDEKIILDDKEYFYDRNSNPNLPDWAVDEFYADITNKIYQMLIEEKKDCIDVPTIRNELYSTKYEKEWIQNGFIEV